MDIETKDFTLEIDKEEVQDWINSCKALNVEIICIVEQDEQDFRVSDSMDSLMRQVVLNETKEQAIRAIIALQSK